MGGFVGPPKSPHFLAKGYWLTKTTAPPCNIPFWPRDETNDAISSAWMLSVHQNSPPPNIKSRQTFSALARSLIPVLFVLLGTFP